jgi:hypothetical protein
MSLAHFIVKDRYDDHDDDYDDNDDIVMYVPFYGRIFCLPGCYPET